MTSFDRRFPKYISPSSFQKYLLDKREYYMQYISPIKPPYMAQTVPMAIGSSFDAYVKSSLYHKVFGKNNPKFELQTLFEAQVEPQNRAVALVDGKHVYEEYVKHGCFADLLLDISASITEPRFESSVEAEIDGVKLSGKPDLSFMNKLECQIVLDWKVNGYYSKSATSPMPGYLRLRENGSKSGSSHKDAMKMMHRGVYINCAHTLDLLKPDWATQLSIYGWVLGQPVGNDCVYMIDQIVAKPSSPRPILRFAEHRLKITPAYQHTLLSKLKEMWEIINSDHFFRDMSHAQSVELCKTLNSTAEGLHGGGTSLDRWFNDAVRSV